MFAVDTALAYAGTMSAKTSKAASKPAAPRTHQAMRDEMRARLVTATAQVLIEHGHAKASVQTICDRAGVTKGALFRHYQSRAHLLAAAADHIFTTLVRRFGERFAGLVPGPDFASRTIALLSEHMADPMMHAARELQTAGRTDEVLRQALGPVLADYHKAAREMAAMLFPNARSHNPHFVPVVEIIIAALNDDARCEQVLTDSDDEKALRDARLTFLARLADDEVLTHEPALKQIVETAQ